MAKPTVGTAITDSVLGGGTDGAGLETELNNAIRLIQLQLDAEVVAGRIEESDADYIMANIQDGLDKGSIPANTTILNRMFEAELGVRREIRKKEQTDYSNYLKADEAKKAEARDIEGQVLNEKAAQEQAAKGRASTLGELRSGAFSKGMDELYSQTPGNEPMPDEYETMFPFLNSITGTDEKAWAGKNANTILEEFRQKYPLAREQWLSTLNAPKWESPEEQITQAEAEAAKWEALLPEYEKVFGGGAKMANANDAYTINETTPWYLNENMDASKQVEGTTYNQLLSGAPAGAADARNRANTMRSELQAGRVNQYGKPTEPGEDPLKLWLKQFPWASRFASQSPSTRGFNSARTRPASQFRI